VTAPLAREIVADLKKLDDDSPGTWTDFIIACPELDGDLKTVHNSLERYRPAGRFYTAQDAVWPIPGPRRCAGSRRPSCSRRLCGRPDHF